MAFYPIVSKIIPLDSKCSWLEDTLISIYVFRISWNRGAYNRKIFGNRDPPLNVKSPKGGPRYEIRPKIITTKNTGKASRMMGNLHANVWCKSRVGAAIRLIVTTVGLLINEGHWCFTYENSKFDWTVLKTVPIDWKCSWPKDPLIGRGEGLISRKFDKVAYPSTIHSLPFSSSC